LHPVSTVLAGGLRCKAERAAEVLRALSFSQTAPDELTMVNRDRRATALFIPPPPGKPVVVIACCWCGDVESGERTLAPLRAELRSELDQIAPQSYTTWQMSHDPTAPHGLRNYWRSTCLRQLDDAAIDWIAVHCLKLPTPMSMIHVHHLAGAVTHGSDDGARGLRRNPYIVNVIGTWQSTQDDSPGRVRRCGDGFADNTRDVHNQFSGADPIDADVAFDERVLAAAK
jgi:hypothetical protein